MVKITSKNRIAFASLILFSLIFLSFGYAASFESTVTPTSINEDTEVLLNFTINNTDATVNITQVNITLPTGFSFIDGTNGTSASNLNFSNTSTTLNWTNTTTEGFIENGSIQYFWFNVTASEPGKYNVTIITLDTSENVNSINVTITVNDTTAPSSIEFVSPTPDNNTNLSQSNIEINVTAEDNGVIDKIVVRLFNSTYNQINSSNSSTSPLFFNFTELPDGVYYFNATVNDTYGNSNSTPTRTVTLDTTAPEITLISPVNKTITNSSTLDFNFTASDHFASTLSCFLVLNGEINETNSSVVNGTETNFTLSELSDGDYNWSINCTDEAGNENASETRILTVDTVAPEITLISPADLTSSTTDAYNFTFNVTDANKVSNCSLIYDGSIVKNLTKVSTEETNGIYLSSLSIGTHTWSINCTDIAGNENESETRTLIVKAPSSGSSGTTYPTYRIDEEELSNGYQKVMRKNWRILFRIDGESHTFKVEDVTKTTAKISISSETQEAILSIGEEKKFEITGDDYYDILVRLNSIDSTNEIYLKANFTIQSINEEIIPLEEEEEITETNETEEIIEEPIEEEPIEEEETIPEEVEEEINETIDEIPQETIHELEKERTKLTALLIAMFVIVILIIFMFIYRRSGKE